MTSIRDKKLERGFSLVELSIAIVVIGLIVGGIFAGQNLVKQAKFRSIVSDYNKYQLALNNFKLQYGTIPGDMSTATSFWPTASNGDNNGIIAQWVTEIPGFWTHLALADFVEGSYSGIWEGTDWQDGALAHRNFPAGPFDGSIYSVYQIQSGMPKSKHRLMLTPQPTLSSGTAPYFLTPSEASSIDTKIDDGKPIGGKVIFYSATYDATSCTASQNVNVAFNLTVTTKICTFAAEMF